ncbi:MAG TPA: hypothetical protein VK348_06165 [Planctomycetota bacterium]|nr:hypothetical protein [Planctomycetota bacterium]
MRRSWQTVLTMVMAGVAALPAQESVEQRLQRLERQNKELQAQVEALGKDVERRDLQGAPAQYRQRGSGDGSATGLEFGGYGEFLFAQPAGGTGVFDVARWVLYVGYRFDPHWSFDSELEVEHTITEATSATTDEGGEVAVEFAHLDYESSRALAVRAGLVLVPMGLYNEKHEPTEFMPATRPETERRILPTTWREGGLGIHGEAGEFAYATYAMTGFAAARFDATGFGEVSQEGNRVAGDALALVGRLDWRGIDDLRVGVSGYHGRTGQERDAAGLSIPELDTSIVEVHGEWRPERFVVRGVFASAWVADATAFDAATGAGVARRLEGYYGELGYDVLPSLCQDTKGHLLPFVRYEHIDTQKQMPSGVPRDPLQADEIFTFGLQYRPIPQLAIKVDYADWTHQPDQFHVALGYVF